MYTSSIGYVDALASGIMYWSGVVAGGGFSDCAGVLMIVRRPMYGGSPDANDFELNFNVFVNNNCTCRVWPDWTLSGAYHL